MSPDDILERILRRHPNLDKADVAEACEAIVEQLRQFGSDDEIADLVLAMQSEDVRKATKLGLC